MRCHRYNSSPTWVVRRRSLPDTLCHSATRLPPSSVAPQSSTGMQHGMLHPSKRRMAEAHRGPGTIERPHRAATHDPPLSALSVQFFLHKGRGNSCNSEFRELKRVQHFLASANSFRCLRLVRGVEVLKQKCSSKRKPRRQTVWTVIAPLAKCCRAMSAAAHRKRVLGLGTSPDRSPDHRMGW